MWVPEGVSKNILKYQVLFPFYFFFVWSFSYPIPQNRFSSTGLTTCDQEHRAQSVPPTSESHNKLTSGFPLTPCRTATSEHSPRFILIVYIIVIIQKSFVAMRYCSVIGCTSELRKRKNLYSFPHVVADWTWRRYHQMTSRWFTCPGHLSSLPAYIYQQNRSHFNCFKGEMD